MQQVKYCIASLLIITMPACVLGQRSAKPFPQHNSYAVGAIRPAHVKQVALDKAVISFYEAWKQRYVKTTAGKNESYIWFEGKGGKQSVSEGQGYGMIITALMAGHDPSSKKTYDNLLRYCRSHPAARSKYLMAWAQDMQGRNVETTSATDGDMDIALSLLLADKQWGSSGAINYLAEARARINAIMQYQINPKSFTVLISDAIKPGSKYYYATRSSDFMPAHFKAFRAATGDARWDSVINAGYSLFAAMQKNYSPDAGLLPDFIMDVHTGPKPAPPGFLEGKHDGDYNYNACRVPWRVAADFLIYGDTRAKKTVAPINAWIRQTTGNDTYNLSAGYSLAGDDLEGRYYESLSFIGPFAVSAMVDVKNQVWLNKVWDFLTGFNINHNGYYDNTIKLLNMLILSGNYWQ